MIKFLDLRVQMDQLAPDLSQVLMESMEQTSFIGGPSVRSFEAEFATFIGVSHCIGVGNGTDALEIAIKSLDLPIGSEILVPANGFFATAESVVNAGYKPRFVDIDSETLNCSAEDYKKVLSTETSALIVVHLYGFPADIYNIRTFCENYGIRLIEDCAQAHGARHSGQAVGSFGDVGCFSFYPGKNLGGFGDGGAILTDNEELALKCRRISNHGRLEKFDHHIIGRNSRLDSLQASILSLKLRKLDQWLNHRESIRKWYLSEMYEYKYAFIPLGYECFSSNHLMILKTDESCRDDVRQALRDGGVETGLHYPDAVSDLSVFQSCYGYQQCFVATRMSKRILSLPMGEHMDRAMVVEICEILKQHL